MPSFPPVSSASPAARPKALKPVSGRIRENPWELEKFGKALHLRFWVAAAIAITGHPLKADQYRSEVREIAPLSEQQQASDPAELLKGTKDPYARALLLRDMAATAANKKDYKRAQSLLQEALKQNALSGPVEQRMKKDLASLGLATGDLKSQLPQLKALVESGDASPQVRVALGAAHLEFKQYRQAIPHLKRGITDTSRPERSWRQALVAAYIGAGENSSAAQLLEDLLREEAADPTGWIQLSALYLKANDKLRAQATMEIASRLGYLKTTDDRLRLVTLTGQIGAPFEAGSVLQTWIKSGLIPDSIENQELLAALWVRAREPQLGLSVLNSIAAKKPSRAVYEQIAQLQLELENYSGAERALAQALQRGRETGPLLMSLGLARYQTADIGGALDAFRQAAAFKPQKSLAMDWITYLESGRAREQALAAAAEAQRSQAREVALSSRLSGPGHVGLGAVEHLSASLKKSTGELTPIGAEREGNEDGTIPDWAGGLSRSLWPPGFRNGGKLLDPYAADRPLFTISASNAAKYAAKLSEGHRALLAGRKGYRLPVYTTRRSVSFPQAIYDATRANRARAELLGSDGLSGAKLGFPFPVPESGVEVMWNHRVRYRGNTAEIQSQQKVFSERGEATLSVQLNERALYEYGHTQTGGSLSESNVLLYYLLRYKGVGINNFVALVHETANDEERPRAAWVAPPKSGRLFRIPAVGYDQPFPGTEGMMSLDMVDMYNGAFDRYVWKLLGKREIHVPYNSFRTSDGSHKYESLLKGRYLNPDAARYELHRVWVIEATERGGKRHSFGLRRFYVDEDSWNVLLVENFDRSGKLWRFQEGHLLPQYDIQAANTYPVVTYDLQDGRYLINRLLAEEPAGQFNIKMRQAEFAPAAVKARYLR